MTATIQQTTTWHKALAQPAAEFPLTPLPLLSGEIPVGLRGTLYRNGPGRLERGGMRVGHWFDGDGAILAVHFTDAGATGLYRYVQTSGYQEEERAGQLLYGNYGMTAPGANLESMAQAAEELSQHLSHGVARQTLGTVGRR